MKLYPLLFVPNLFELIWGGKNISIYKGLNNETRKIGESWEISNIPGKESIISNGPLHGETLQYAINEYGALLLGREVAKKYAYSFPVLIKFIDAEQNLSIQVHPNDELAQMRHKCHGKSEMWLILDAKPGSFLYIGFKKEISKEEYSKRVADGTICDVLKKHEVHRGDIFYIPAGRIHAIGEGILLVEVQQSSDITYRIFDYNRLGLDGKPRKLHTELATDAIDYHVEKEYKTHYKIRKNRPSHAISCPFFQINLLYIDKCVTRHLKKCDSFIAVTCLKGLVKISIEGETDDNCTLYLQKAHSCLIPASLANYIVTPLQNLQACLLETFIDNYNPWHKSMKRIFLSIIE